MFNTQPGLSTMKIEWIEINISKAAFKCAQTCGFIVRQDRCFFDAKIENGKVSNVKELINAIAYASTNTPHKTYKAMGKTLINKVIKASAEHEINLAQELEAAKQAEEARRIEEARKAAEMTRRIEEARKAAPFDILSLMQSPSTPLNLNY